MAYNVEQLQDLQRKIGSEPVMPNSLSRRSAFEGLKRQAQGMTQSKPQRRNTFQPRTMQKRGQPDMRNDAQNLASKGRYGDTMLMHVTPDEVRGLSSLRGGVTINPETGLPEAFPWLPVLAGAAIGGVGSAATGGDPLKGAAFGALGGFMPTALGGIAGLSPGLTAGWNALGSIGQGMLSGAAMGGIRGLFGDSDSPLRDILIGAAMGGVTGAVFPGTVEAAGQTGVGYGESAREFLGGPAVPMAEDVTRSAVAHPLSQNINEGFGYNFAGDAPTQLSIPSIARGSGRWTMPHPPAGDFSVRPPDALQQIAGTPDYIPGDIWSDIPGDVIKYRGDVSVPAQTGTTPDSLESNWLDYADTSPVTDYRTMSTSYETPFYDKTDPFKALGVKRSPWEKGVEWFKERPTWQQVGMLGGTGLLGATMLQESPEQAEIPGLTTASAIPEVGPFPLRTPIGGRDQEFYERTIGEGRTPEEAEYFTEEDINVAKEGGLVELAVGGNTSVFEGRVQGQGDGMADQVAFNVIPQTPADIPNTPDMALLSSDEYVVPADVVSMLGNGSSTAGAQALDQFNKLMRHKAHGTNKQQREINPATELSSLI